MESVADRLSSHPLRGEASLGIFTMIDDANEPDLPVGSSERQVSTIDKCSAVPLVAVPLTSAAATRSTRGRWVRRCVQASVVIGVVVGCWLGYRAWAAHQIEQLNQACRVAMKAGEVDRLEVLATDLRERDPGSALPWLYLADVAQRPEQQWWMELRTIARVLAKTDPYA